MNRYTSQQLESDLSDYNQTLERVGHEYRFGISYAYNRTQLDLCTPAQLANHCRQKMLDCGTPRECLAAAKAYIADYVFARVS